MSDQGLDEWEEHDSVALREYVLKYSSNGRSAAEDAEEKKTSLHD